MGPSETSSARLLLAVQVLVVITITVAANFVTDALNFRSPANALWMVALPAALALALNNSVRQRAVMAVALVSLSLLTSVIVRAVVIGYP